MTDATVDFQVSSPVGELRYRPHHPWADEGPHGMRLQWQPDHFGCLEACIGSMLSVDFDEVPRGPRGRPHESRGDRVPRTAGRLARGARVPDASWADHPRGIESLLDRRECRSAAGLGPHGRLYAAGRSCTIRALSFGLQFVDAGLEVEPVTRLDKAIVFDRLENR